MRALAIVMLCRIASADPDVGGELREWVEGTRHVLFGSSSDAGWMQRARVHANVVVPHLRLFIEPISGLEYGRDIARPSDKDSIDLHTAYLEMSPAATTFVRVGRQELGFGSGRLLDTRDGPNIRASYDGARAHAESAGASVDAFLAREVAITPGAFDDSSRAAHAIWGTYATYKNILDVYALGTHREASYQRVAGDEARYTFGARVRVSHGELETAVQRGEIAGVPVKAWLVGGEIVVAWLTLGGGITSGDSGKGALGTFAPLSFRAGYFGYLAANGALNEIGLHAAAKRELPHHVTLLGEVWEFWRENLEDGVYGLTGTLLRSAGPSDPRFIGTQVQALATWQIDRVTIGVTIAQFYVRRLLANNITYAASWATYAF